MVAFGSEDELNELSMESIEAVGVMRAVVRCSCDVQRLLRLYQYGFAAV